MSLGGIVAVGYEPTGSLGTIRGAPGVALGAGLPPQRLHAATVRDLLAASIDIGVRSEGLNSKQCAIHEE
jgi:hypothetical protein